MERFSPLESTLGGILIGVASALLLWSHGRIAGVSGIVGGLLGRLPHGDAAWRLAFAAGLLSAGVGFSTLSPASITADDSPTEPLLLIAAGLLVGLGTRIGNGCTSGHGVCGISRLSRRSIVATSLFIASGIITVTLMRR